VTGAAVHTKGTARRIDLNVRFRDWCLENEKVAKCVYLSGYEVRMGWNYTSANKGERLNI
jgi:hypothetical protein